MSNTVAPEREVLLDLEQPASADAFDGLGQVERLEGCQLTLRVPRHRLTAVVALLLERFSVRDLEVKDPPIEALIAPLFQRGCL